VQRHALVLSWLVLWSSSLPAQSPARLDAARVVGPELRSTAFGPVRWIDAAHYVALETTAAGVPELVRYAAESGERSLLVSAPMLWLPERGEALVIEDYTLSPDGAAVLLFSASERVWRQRTRGEFHVLGLDGKAPPRRLGGDLPRSSLQFAKWSPDGMRVAYTAQHDLYVERVADGQRTRLTEDGSRTLVNGTFDWVYEEEFDCRDGFRWSPDGSAIAFWQLDSSGVGEFAMIDNLSDRYSRIVPVQFPKAGTTNSSARIGVVPAGGGEVRWLRTPGEPRECYLPRMEWHPQGRELMVQWLPRAQNVLQVLGGDVASGACRVVHEEQDEAYVDVRDDFRWLYGGEKFFWTSDTAFHAGDGPRFRQCGMIEWDTRGKQVLLTSLPLSRGFDVIAVRHVDVAREQLYVTASAHGARQELRLVQLAGGGAKWRTPEPRPLVAGSAPPQWSDYDCCPDGSLAIRTASSFGVPPVVELVRLPGHEVVRTLVDHRALRAACQAIEKGNDEFFTVDLGDGAQGDGWAMYPPDFDAARQWPVVFHVYGEPWSQVVLDRWDLRHHLFHRWLTQLGYVVMAIDARGTPAPKGRDWRKALFQQIGVRSSADWHAAVTKLRAQHAWMDPRRQAIWGWSGGGAMTLNLLFRYPDLFAAGIAVAPVTDIALYDTIYQEKYCGDPRRFPEVYRRCSPITFAKDLQAALLLVHGTGDDNVHYQHSERLVDELVRHGKLFECLPYPNRTHALAEGDGTRAHLYAALADFLQRRVASGPRPAVERR
jgi:dipeptidyl-peptidase 4